MKRIVLDKNDLKLCLSFSEDKTRKQMNGIYVDIQNERISITNGKMICVRKLSSFDCIGFPNKTKMPEENFIIPKLVIENIYKKISLKSSLADSRKVVIEELECETNLRKFVAIFIEGDFGYQFLEFSENQGGYPNIDSPFLKPEFISTFTISSELLKDMISSLDTVTGLIFHVKNEGEPITVCINNKDKTELFLLSQNNKDNNVSIETLYKSLVFKQFN